MKTTFKAILMVLAIFASAPTFAQDIGPLGGEQDGTDSKWYSFSCGSPMLDGHPIVGVQYELKVAAYEKKSKWYVTGASLKSAPVVPNPVWTSIGLHYDYQSKTVARFHGNDLTVTVQRDDLDTTVRFSSGAVMSCSVNP